MPAEQAAAPGSGLPSVGVGLLLGFGFPPGVNRTELQKVPASVTNTVLSAAVSLHFYMGLKKKKKPVVFFFRA